MKRFMKKIICAVLVFALAASALTGCFPSAENNTDSAGKGNSAGTGNSTNIGSLQNQTNPNDVSKYPTLIEDRDIENLIIKVNVHMPDRYDLNRVLTIVTAEPKSWDRSRIVSAVANGRAVTEESSGENSGPDDLFYSYELNDNSYLRFSNGCAGYYTEAADEYEYDFYFDTFENNKDSLQKFFGNTDIDGISRGDAIDKANELIALLGIGDIVGAPQVYALSAENANYIRQEFQMEDKYGNAVPEWGAEQEAYYIVYPMQYQTISAMGLAGSLETGGFYSTAFRVIYGRSGLIEFEADNIYDLKETVQEGFLYPPTDVVAGIKEYFSDVILDSVLWFSNLSLTYVVTYENDSLTKWKVEPVWFTQGKFQEDPTDEKAKKGTSGRTFTVMVSAVTGETIPVTSVAR